MVFAETLKILPGAAAQGNIFKPEVTVFPHYTDLPAAVTLFFFPVVIWLTSGFDIFCFVNESA